MSWKALDSKLGTTDDFHYLKNKLQTLDKVYSSYSESGGYSHTRTLGVCLPRALPGSSHAPDQRAFSLTNNPEGLFFMVCVLLPRPDGEPKTFRCGVVTTRLRTSNPFGRGTLRYCSGTEPEGRNWVFNHITIRLFVSGERPSFFVPLYRPELVGLLG